MRPHAPSLASLHLGTIAFLLWLIGWPVAIAVYRLTSRVLRTGGPRGRRDLCSSGGLLPNTDRYGPRLVFWADCCRRRVGLQADTVMPTALDSGQRSPRRKWFLRMGIVVALVAPVVLALTLPYSESAVRQRDDARRGWRDCFGDLRRHSLCAELG